jgi:serine-type D-Ala-D-Ala carboxypeptidase (penicillin-binding protein 5/6)
MKEHSPENRRALRITALAVLLCTCASVSLFFYTRSKLNEPVLPVSKPELDLALSAYSHGLGALPAQFADSETSLLPESVFAQSAILVDTTTGKVLFEKNADAPIPPASMTKLVAMYTAFHAAERGEISLDEVVALPPESWAVNIPSGSSLMFLAEGQRVTVRELLLGMAVVSGNDAAIALACHVSGSVEAFVTRMNAEVRELGLTITHFVEPSGLSELNMTTAREFASFAVVYLNAYPEALRAFHSKTELAYPAPQNLPLGSIQRPVYQSATNRLLGVLPGCDGLKTGFIYESGFNLSLTAERSLTRFLCVTMGGPGLTSREGNEYRNRDGTTLMEWAFTNFLTARPEEPLAQKMVVWEGKKAGVMAVPAGKAAFTAPVNALATGEQIEKRISMPRNLTAPVQAGDQIGTIEYLIQGRVMHTVALVADRSVAQASLPARTLDRLARFASSSFGY